MQRLSSWIDLLAEACGALAPVLLVVSLITPENPLPTIAWLAAWMGIGHTVLFWYRMVPEVNFRPALRGAFAFLLGLMWPLWWCLVRRMKTR